MQNVPQFSIRLVAALRLNKSSVFILADGAHFTRFEPLKYIRTLTETGTRAPPELRILISLASSVSFQYRLDTKLDVRTSLKECKLVF